MLASRLTRIAADIVADYDKFQIQKLAVDAIEASKTAHAWNPAQYHQAAVRIRGAAQEIIDNHVLRKYPQPLRDVFLQSDYRQIAPRRIARIIRDAFQSDNKDEVMPSSELTAYLQPINPLLGLLRTFVNANHAFKVEEISIPDGTISLDLRFPRELIDNSALEALRFETAFIKAAADFIELATGSAEPPLLVYSSTTDLVVAIAMVPAACWGFLKLYDQILTVALKQVEVLQAIKTFRGMKTGKAPADAMSASMKDEIEDLVREAVTKAMNGVVQPKVDEARRNEINNSLNNNAPIMLEAVMGGGRVNVTVESLATADAVTEQAHVGMEKQIDDAIEERNKLEYLLTQQLDLYNSGEKPLLLTSNKSDAQ